MRQFRVNNIFGLTNNGDLFQRQGRICNGEVSIFSGSNIQEDSSQFTFKDAITGRAGFPFFRVEDVHANFRGVNLHLTSELWKDVVSDNVGLRAPNVRRDAVGTVVDGESSLQVTLAISDDDRSIRHVGTSREGARAGTGAFDSERSSARSNVEAEATASHCNVRNFLPLLFRCKGDFFGGCTW